jgi:hypothetical protein
LTTGLLKDYQTNALAEGCRKCTQNSGSGTQPLFRCPTVSLGLNELLNMGLSVEYIENSAGRLATFELGCETMFEKVILCLLFIIFQSSMENGLEI